MTINAQDCVVLIESLSLNSGKQKHLNGEKMSKKWRARYGMPAAENGRDRKQLKHMEEADEGLGRAQVSLLRTCA